MGAWGSGIFENDDALDWIADFSDEPTSGMVRETLAAVTDPDDDEYLEAPECSKAIAAAEVVAALHGAGTQSAPEQMRSSMASIPSQPDPGLVALAVKAVNRIKLDSELKELWEEASDPGEWYAVIDDLERRLNGITA